MIIITQKAGTLGIFKMVEEKEDRLVCDDRIEFPFSVIGTYEINEDDSLMTTVVDLDPLKRDFIVAIDDHVAAICAKWMRFQAGYVEREAAARAFKAANYAGDAGDWITSFATPAGLTPTVAANLIIAQAEGLKAALKALEAARMKKYSVARATTEQAVRAAYAAVILEANTIAAGIS